MLRKDTFSLFYHCLAVCTSCYIFPVGKRPYLISSHINLYSSLKYDQRKVLSLEERTGKGIKKNPKTPSRPRSSLARPRRPGPGSARVWPAAPGARLAGEGLGEPELTWRLPSVRPSGDESRSFFLPPGSSVPKRPVCKTFNVSVQSYLGDS